MRTDERRELSTDLLRARNRFEAWRGRRNVGSRIPQSLWTLAVRLVNTHGVSRTSAVLGLDYYSLKERTEAVAHPPQSNGPAFVELPSPIGKQCLFELDNGAGATMRIQLVGYDASEIETLARGFWNGE
jgi:hypothetical protein